MPIFSRDSLENLRQRIDIVDVLSAHLDLKPTGASYKGLCPFHDEKTPSFVVQKGDHHYHCFGCGAHGDAIQFLMAHLKMSFLEAVESLAQRFQVPLEQIDQGNEQKGPDKGKLRDILEFTARFYHFLLLHTQQGHRALHYLYRRGIDLDFIRSFQLGLSPNTPMLRQVMHEKGISDQLLFDAGLLGKDLKREFFSDRIMFPIHNASGSVIGFSGRKYKEETFGGKYINSPETALFKKSRTLYGLHHCRRRIAKERKAILVEGQIDTLRLIHTGFDISVAAQGTAFGEGHAKELVSLGINQIYLALDADNAGREAACKIGDIFQKEGVAVSIITLPEGSDPDTFLREEGPEMFQKLLEKGEDYLPFLVHHHGKTLNLDTPAGKNELVNKLAQQIRRWEHPLMIHESLRKLANLIHVPEDMVGVGQIQTPNVYIKRSSSVGLQEVDPDRVLECDLLRWLLLLGESHPQFLGIVHAHIDSKHFRIAACAKLYQTFLEHHTQQKPCDLLSLAISLDDPEGQLLMSELLQKRVNKERAEQHLYEAIQKVLDRHWMQEREHIKMKIQTGDCSDEEVMQLVKQFDTLKSHPPKVDKALK